MDQYRNNNWDFPCGAPANQPTGTAASAQATSEIASPQGSLAVTTGSGSVSSAEVERDDMSDRAAECEQIAHFLYRIGDTEKALQRMREAEGLRRQVAAIDKRQPSPNE